MVHIHLRICEHINWSSRQGFAQTTTFNPNHHLATGWGHRMGPRGAGWGVPQHGQRPGAVVAEGVVVQGKVEGPQLGGGPQRQQRLQPLRQRQCLAQQRASVAGWDTLQKKKSQKIAKIAKNCETSQENPPTCCVLCSAQPASEQKKSTGSTGKVVEMWSNVGKQFLKKWSFANVT